MMYGNSLLRSCLFACVIVLFLAPHRGCVGVSTITETSPDQANAVIKSKKLHGRRKAFMLTIVTNFVGRMEHYSETNS